MTHIWVPKVKIHEAELPRRNRTGLAGEYVIRKYKVGFKEPVQTVGPFHNVITNWGVDRLGSGLSVSYLYIGTGTTPAAFSDEQMGVYVARTNSDQSSLDANGNMGSPTYGSWTTIGKRFHPGDAVGTFTEVGFGDAGSVPPTSPATYRLFSRSLIVDEYGAPIAITVLSDEYLDVTFTVRAYPLDLDDVTDIVNIGGVNYTFVHRPFRLSNVAVNSNTISNRAGFISLRNGTNVTSSVAYSGTAAGTPPALAAVTDTAMLNAGSGGSPSAHSYSYLGSQTSERTLTFGLGNGNLTYGIRGLVTTTGSGIFQYYRQSTISPAIPKDATKILGLAFQFSYGRYSL